MERGTNEKAPEASATAVTSRPSIAVLGFKNLSSRTDTGWLSTALSEMVSTELAAGGQLRTVPAENVSRARLELSLKDDEATPKETFSQLYKNVGADFLIDGSYLVAGGNRQLRVDLRVSNAKREAVFALSESGPESDLFSIVSKAGYRLREQLGLNETASNEVAKARAAFSQKPEAIRLYTEGLAKLRVFDAISALPLLQKAAELDSSQPLTYSAIAAAWAKLGYDAKAADSAQKAYELSTNLTREERLSIEGRYRESQKDWIKAIDIYKTLWGFFSDDVEYGLRLSAAQIAGGKGSDALTTVVAMRQLPAPASGDPRVDVAEGDALGSLSEFKRQQQVYAQAEKKVRSSRARLLLAATRLAEGRAFYNLGQPENAISALEEAKSVFAAAGDKAGIASALSSLASVYGDQTDIPHEIQMHQQSLAISREIGDKRLTSSSLNNLASLFKDQGRYDDALKLHEEALALRREIGDKSWTANSLNNIGVVFFEQDRFSEAQKNYMESLEICREIGDRRGLVRALHNLSVVKRELGKLAEARKGYEESLAIRQEIGDKRGGVIGRVELAMVLIEMGELASAKRTIEEAFPLARDTKLRPGEAMAFFLLGEIALAEDDLPAARKHHEAALQIRKELREDRTILESRVALANIALEEGHALDAEAAINDLQKDLSGGGPAPAQTMADLLLVQALLDQNKISAAAVAMMSAQKMAVAAQRQDERAMNIITDARLYSARKQPEVALQKLDSLLAGLNRNGAIQLQFETRLALCEARFRSSQSSGAQECSISLAKDSENRGFKRIARKARLLLRDR